MTMDRIRLDKWLWAARFYKTRSLAVDEIGKGRVQVNGQPAKPAREVGPGDVISIRKEDPPPSRCAWSPSAARAARRRWRASYMRKPRKAPPRANARPRCGGWRPSRRWTSPPADRPSATGA